MDFKEETEYTKSLRRATWYNVKFLKSHNKRFGMDGCFEKGETGYGCVTDNGEVVLWTGKGFEIKFKNVDEAKKYATCTTCTTCTTKCENKTTAIIREFDRMMF